MSRLDELNWQRLNTLTAKLGRSDQQYSWYLAPVGGWCTWFAGQSPKHPEPNCMNRTKVLSLGSKRFCLWLSFSFKYVNLIQAMDLGYKGSFRCSTVQCRNIKLTDHLKPWVLMLVPLNWRHLFQLIKEPQKASAFRWGKGIHKILKKKKKIYSSSKSLWFHIQSYQKIPDISWLPEVSTITKRIPACSGHIRTHNNKFHIPDSQPTSALSRTPLEKKNTYHSCLSGRGSSEWVPPSTIDHIH